METKNFQQLQNELNQSIVNEVKSVLGKLPLQKFNFTSVRPHIIVSRNDDYHPTHVAVVSMWINTDEDDVLYFKSADGELYDEYDDLLNIADLQYAIDEIKRTIVALNYEIEKIKNTMNTKYYHIEWPESQEWMEHEQAIPVEGMSCFIPCDVYDK